MVKNFISIVFLVLAFSLKAQINQYGYPLYTYYDSKDYNAYDQFWDIAVDKNGLIYAANNFDGVLQFDGVTWRKIPIEGNPEVRSITIDSVGNIYIGCSSDFGVLKPELDGSLKYTSLNVLPKSDSIAFSYIYKINIIENTVQFSSDNSILFSYNLILDSLEISFLPEYTLYTFKAHEKLIGSSYIHGLYEFENGNKTILSGGSFFSKKNIFALKDYGDSFRIITGKQGIYDYSKNTGEANQILHPLSKEYLSNYVSYDADFLEEEVLVATIGSGVVHCNSIGKIENIFDDEIGIKDHICASVRNLNNSVWCALANGISRFEFNSPFRKFAEGSGLEGYLVNAVVYNDEFYIATEFALYRLDKGGIEKPNFTKLIDIDQQIFSMIIFNENSNREKLVLGTTDGIFLYNEFNEKLIPLEENLVGAEKYATISKNDARNSNTKEKLYVTQLFQ